MKAMNYKIVFDKPAQKFLLKQPPEQRKRLLSAIKKLPYAGDIKAMHGYTGYFRLRVGSYRVIYSVDNDVLIICVVNIGNRGDIYKK
mgnify:CR=1 FL=1